MSSLYGLVLVVSPLTHDHEWGRRLHAAYLDACLHDSLMRGETPVATHKLYPGPLDDSIPHERELGMRQRDVLLKHCAFVAVYTDLGVSKGMHLDVEAAERHGFAPLERRLYNQV